jgi:hypothetical protein
VPISPVRSITVITSRFEMLSTMISPMIAFTTSI